MQLIPHTTNEFLATSLMLVSLLIIIISIGYSEYKQQKQWKKYCDQLDKSQVEIKKLVQTIKTQYGL
jgi:hypothetical protein